jgi:hypothetical protein
LEGLEEDHCFFYGTIFVLVVKNVESIGRLWVVVFDVALVLFATELEAAAGLAHIHLVACYA